MLAPIRHLISRPPWIFGSLSLLGLMLCFRSANLATAALDPVPGRHPKLSALLADLARATPQERVAVSPDQGVAPPPGFSVERMPKSVRDAVHGRMMRINQNAEVQVYILVAKLTDDNLRQLGAAGATVELQDAERRIVQARVPVTHLEMVASLPFVRLVRLPSYAVRHTGSVDTEGDSILKADQVRAQLHVDGTGVRVGVISDGLKGIFATGCATCGGVTGGPISTGDLPNATGTRNASGVLTSSSSGITGKSFSMSSDLEGLPPAGCAFAGAGAEGTAILEIIHDLAPGAQLSFANADTELEFIQAVNFLAGNNDIVIDDLGFFGEPNDGTSIVSSNTAAALNSSTNPIRAYFTAVGNEAKRHYHGDFDASGGDGASITGSPGNLHMFRATANTTDALGLGATPYDKIQLPASAQVSILVNWNDPFGSSTNDYDLLLLQESTSKVVAASKNKTCFGSQYPVACIPGYTNTTGAQDYFHIIVQNPQNLAPKRTLDMFILTPECAAAGPASLAPTHEKHNYNTPAGSVPNESDAGGSPVSVTAVAAICSGSPSAISALPDCANDPTFSTIEFFSSNGPTLDGRLKPDVTAIDGVSITGAGSFENPFFGSSAAAPHAAGVAALLLQAAPCLRSGAAGARDNVTARTTLRNMILNNAVDLGAPGPDNVFGYGRIDALAAANRTIPTASGVPSQTVVSGNAQNGANIPLNGIGFSDPTGCPLTFNWTGGCGTGSGTSMTCPFGTNAASLTASNNGVTLSASASIQITVTTFGVGVSPAQATIKAGQAATYTVSLTPQYGAFSNTILLGCSGLPALASCSFSPNSVTPGANATTSTLTVSTTAASALHMPPPADEEQRLVYALLEKLSGIVQLQLEEPALAGTVDHQAYGKSAEMVGTALAVAALGFFAALAKRRRRILFFPSAVILGWLALQVACGGGGPSGPKPGTPAGTYTISITGTSGSLEPSANTALTVQ